MILNVNFAAMIRGVAQPGSARVWGAWGRKFKSCHPDKSTNPCCESNGDLFFHRDDGKLVSQLDREKTKTEVSETNEGIF